MVDLQIQGQWQIMRDLLYLSLYSCYRKDPDVYSHIIEAKDHNNNTEILEHFWLIFKFKVTQNAIHYFV